LSTSEAQMSDQQVCVAALQHMFVSGIQLTC